MRYIFLILALLLLVGCGNDFDRSKPVVPNATNSPKKVYGNTPQVDRKVMIESAKIKAANQKEIALINKDRDISLQKLRQETTLHKAGIEKEIEFKKSDTEIVIMQHSISVQKIYVGLIALAMFFATIFTFYFLQKRRKDRLKMHEDILQKDIYMKDRELQAKMADRILDTLERGKLAPEQQAKLVETFTQNTVVTPATQIETKNIDMEITNE
ncbi:MAG: hypothetical protein U9P71_01850 [Campylobacterota bacterium]|nr:hypothetical protein [Campylobacterota bacterium]